MSNMIDPGELTQLNPYPTRVLIENKTSPNVSHVPNIRSDQVIEFKGFYSRRKLPYRLRCIHACDPHTGKRVVLSTNQMSWSAATVAAVYKDRWQVELFFKTLKQQLKVKSFVGTSPNALLSQLWVALIAYLLLSYLKFKSRFGWSLYTLSSILPTNLFVKRPLWVGSTRHLKRRHQPHHLGCSISWRSPNLDSYVLTPSSK